jgi:hypothetical protein
MPAMGAAATPLRGLFAAEAAPTEGVERLVQRAWAERSGLQKAWRSVYRWGGEAHGMLIVITLSFCCNARYNAAIYSRD